MRVANWLAWAATVALIVAGLFMERYPAPDASCTTDDECGCIDDCLD